MTPEQERWAEALAVLRVHGRGALTHVAGRVTALAEQGDMAGVRRWTEIAVKLDELSEAEDRPQ